MEEERVFLITFTGLFESFYREPGKFLKDSCYLYMLEISQYKRSEAPTLFHLMKHGLNLSEDITGDRILVKRVNEELEKSKPIRRTFIHPPEGDYFPGRVLDRIPEYALPITDFNIIMYGLFGEKHSLIDAPAAFP